MGANFSKDITPPPLTLRDCLINGQINLPMYYYYRCHLDHYMKYTSQLDLLRKKRKKRSFQDPSTVVKCMKARSVK